MCSCHYTKKGCIRDLPAPPSYERTVGFLPPVPSLGGPPQEKEWAACRSHSEHLSSGEKPEVTIIERTSWVLPGGESTFTSVLPISSPLEKEQSQQVSLPWGNQMSSHMTLCLVTSLLQCQGGVLHLWTEGRQRQANTITHSMTFHCDKTSNRKQTMLGPFSGTSNSGNKCYMLITLLRGPIREGMGRELQVS